MCDTQTVIWSACRPVWVYNACVVKLAVMRCDFVTWFVYRISSSNTQTKNNSFRTLNSFPNIKSNTNPFILATKNCSLVTFFFSFQIQICFHYRIGGFSNDWILAICMVSWRKDIFFSKFELNTLPIYPYDLNLAISQSINLKPFITFPRNGYSLKLTYWNDANANSAKAS